MKEFYVYIWRDPKDNIPRYVGKGAGSRCWNHIEDTSKAKYARMLKKRVRAGFVCIPQLVWVESDEEACELEVLLIAEIGRKDLGKGPLFNLNDGGTGGQRNPSTLTRRRMSRSQRRAWRDGTRDAIAISNVMKDVWARPGYRKRLRVAIAKATAIAFRPKFSLKEKHQYREALAHGPSRPRAKQNANGKWTRGSWPRCSWGNTAKKFGVNPGKLSMYAKGQNLKDLE